MSKIFFQDCTTGQLCFPNLGLWNEAVPDMDRHVQNQKMLLVYGTSIWAFNQWALKDLCNSLIKIYTIFMFEIV